MPLIYYLSEDFLLDEECAQGLFGTGCLGIILHRMQSLIVEGSLALPRLNYCRCTCSHLESTKKDGAHRTYEEGGGLFAFSEMIKGI